MDVIWNSVARCEWTEAARSSLAPLQQSLEYGEVCSAIGLEVMRARITGAGASGYAQVLVRRVFGVRRFALLSRGPIWPDGTLSDTGASAALLNTIPMGRISALLATPNTNGPLIGIPMMSSVTVAELSLFADEATQRTNMHGKWRNRLVRSESLGLKIEQIGATPALIEMLLAREAKQQKYKRYRNLPPHFLRRFAQIHPEKTHILVNRERGKINAAMIFLRHGKTATYFMGWREVEPSVPVHNLMLWRGMRLLAERNIARLDLGSLDTLNAPSLARFKLGSGAQGRRLGETYLLRRE